MSGRDVDRATTIRCREIGIADLESVADLLTRGFAGRSRDYWMDGLARMSVRDVPHGFPRFGYMIDHRGVTVGALLSIYFAKESTEGTSVWCNLSSWYVEPVYRNYSMIMAKIAQRHKQVTYLNISPARWTWRTLEVLGFRTYCNGMFFSFPSLSSPAKGMHIERVRHDTRAVEGLSKAEVTLLARHAAYGCLSIVCRAADGRRFPFVLQPLRVRQIALPAMQMIYCSDVADYVACAGAIGRFLLRRGRISVALDANGPLKDLVGFYREPLGRKYFKGPQCPRLADLSDTELVLYGP
jgi:hypothetical protein